MRKNPHDRILKLEPKEQYLSLALRIILCILIYIYIYIYIKYIHAYAWSYKLVTLMASLEGK